MYICGCVCIYIYEMFFYNCKLENSKWKLKFGSMLVFCLLFMAWKNTTQLPKHLCISHMSTWGVQSSKKKRINYSMCNIYLMVWRQEIEKNCQIKRTEKRRQNQIQPQGTWTFVSGLHKEMGNLSILKYFCTKVAVF